MIIFRCWYCNKAYSVSEERIGTTLNCTCKHTIRIPKKNHGPTRIRKPVDFLVETLVYGGGGGLLGASLGVWLSAEIPWILGGRKKLVLTLALMGFLIGFFGGERGINWIGRMLRDREER